MEDKDKFYNEANKMIEEAETRTGLHDWGNRDNILSTLSILLRSLDDIREYAKQEFVSSTLADLQDKLCWRLKIEQEIKLNPRVKDIEIKNPVFIIGCPRTGSTLLHSLLSSDSLSRSPFLWEMKHPTNDNKQKRIETSEKYVSVVRQKNPSNDSMHHLDPLGIEECSQALSYDLWYVPLFVASPISRDLYFGQPHNRLVDTYKFHKLMMQLFVHQNPGEQQHWVFKAVHIKFMQQLIEVYPDAKFIWIHRDPVAIVSSYMGLAGSFSGSMFRESAPQSFHSKRIERHLYYMGDFLSNGSRVISEWEKKGNPPLVLHCKYSDMKQDPEKMIQKLYEKLNFPFSPLFQENLKRELNKMEIQHKTKPYSHSLAEVGLDEERVRFAFKDYLDYYHNFQFVEL